MTSFKQIAANRLNALRSTGPRTQEGKHQSRRNALGHGLTAETVIDGLEDTEDYRAFEAVIISDYDAQTAVAARGPRRRNSEHPGADIEDPHGPGPHISPRTGRGRRALERG